MERMVSVFFHFNQSDPRDQGRIPGVDYEQVRTTRKMTPEGRVVGIFVSETAFKRLEKIASREGVLISEIVSEWVEEIARKRK